MRVLGKQDSMRVPGEQVKVATAEVIKAPPTTVKCEEAKLRLWPAWVSRPLERRIKKQSRNAKWVGSRWESKRRDAIQVWAHQQREEQQIDESGGERRFGKRTQSKVQVTIQQKSCRIAGRGRWTAVDGEAGGERAKSSVTGKEERDNQVMMSRGQP